MGRTDDFFEAALHNHEVAFEELARYDFGTRGGDAYGLHDIDADLFEVVDEPYYDESEPSE